MSFYLAFVDSYIIQPIPWNNQVVTKKDILTNVIYQQTSKNQKTEPVYF